jgi:hypothetical protein
VTELGSGRVRPAGAPPIRRLRLMTAGFAVGMVGVVAALGVALPLRGEYPVGWASVWAGFTVAAALAGAAVRSRLAARIASASGPAEVADRYTTRLITGLGFALAPALAGTAVAFWIDGFLPALIAAPVSLALLLWMGPTDADVRTVQERADAAGRTIDVAGALARSEAST